MDEVGQGITALRRALASDERRLSDALNTHRIGSTVLRRMWNRILDIQNNVARTAPGTVGRTESLQSYGRRLAAINRAILIAEARERDDVAYITRLD